MPWLLLDVLLGVLALVVLGLVAYTLYRHIRVLMRTVSAASARVGSAMPPAMPPAMSPATPPASRAAARP